MFIKIYFNDTPLFLSDNIDETINEYLHHDDAIFIDEFSTPAIKSMIHEMQLEKIHAGIFYHSDLEALKKAFFKKFTLITAAGGLVINGKKDILMIHRRGKWDLPKGKLDAGETIEECAVREVEEETGLKDIELKKPLVITYHTYHQDGKHILKDSHWYLMHIDGTQDLVPQTEEDIAEAKWVTKKDVPALLNEAFPAIRDVMEVYGIGKKK